MTTTDLDLLTQQHTNRGRHLRLLAHVEAVTGMTPDIQIDESGEYAVAIWWQSTNNTHEPVAHVATEFDDNTTTPKHYIYLNIPEGEFTSTTTLATELATAQTILQQIQHATDSTVKASERHAQPIT